MPYRLNERPEDPKEPINMKPYLMPPLRVAKLLLIIPYMLVWICQMILAYPFALLLSFIMTGHFRRFLINNAAECYYFPDDVFPRWHLKKEYRSRTEVWDYYEWRGLLPYPGTLWNLFEEQEVAPEKIKAPEDCGDCGEL